MPDEINSHEIAIPPAHRGQDREGEQGEQPDSGIERPTAPRGLEEGRLINYADYDGYSSDDGSDSSADDVEGADFEVEQNPSIQWVTSQRGKQILIFKGRIIWSSGVATLISSYLASLIGFKFYRYCENTREATTVYRCSEYENDSPVLVWMDGEEYIKHKEEHDHSADPIDIPSLQVKEKALKIVQTNPLLVCSRL